MYELLMVTEINGNTEENSCGCYPTEHLAWLTAARVVAEETPEVRATYARRWWFRVQAV